MPTRSNDYQLPSWPPTKIDRALWNAVMADLAARLTAREALEATFEVLQEQGVQAALDYIQVSVAPQLSALQQSIANAQSAIDLILGGNAPNAQKLGGQPPSYYAKSSAVQDLSLSVEAIPALIQQRIAALVDSSPAALDTLKELAAALGNDANFSTTVMNAIGKKLGLAGGTLTGDVLFGPGTEGKLSKLQANGDVQLNRGDNTGYNTWNANNAYFGWDGARYVFGPAGPVALTGPELRMDYDGANASYYATGDIRFGGYMATEFGAGLSAALRSANSGLGKGQTWQNVVSSRAAGTVYQNTTGKPIVVSMMGWARNSFCEGQVSADNQNWLTPNRGENIYSSDTAYYYARPIFVVPPMHYYRLTVGGNYLGLVNWIELR